MAHRLLIPLAALLAFASPARAEITFAQAPDSPLGSAFAARLTGDITTEDYWALRDRVSVFPEAVVVASLVVLFQ